MKKGFSTMTLLLLMLLIVGAVLGALSAATAHADLRRAMRQAAYVTAMQGCTNDAQDWLHHREMQAAAGALDGTTAQQTFTDGAGHTLQVEISIESGRCTVLRWQSSTTWNGDTSPGELLRIE